MNTSTIADSEYIRFIEIALNLVCIIPPYANKYSKKTYTQQQLMILLILKQKLGLSYQRLIEDLKTRPKILLLLGLNKLPSPSTLKMFAKRIKSDILHKMIGKAINFTRKRTLTVAIDSTGFHVEDGSYYYRKRLGLSTKVKKFVKLSAVVDTDKQIILSVKVRKKLAHDNRDFKPLIKKASKIKKIKAVVGDKSYDCEDNHRFVVEDLRAECIIPPRDYGKKARHKRFSYRNKLKKRYSKRKYHQRSKIETVFFVIKKLFGAVLLSKKWLMQMKEQLLRVLA